MVSSWFLYAMIAAAFVTDASRMKIPNKLTAGGVLCGMALHVWLNGLGGLVFALQGCAAGFGVMFLLYLAGALGAGDVKLFAAVGALTGAEYAIVSAIYSVMYAGAAAVLLLLWRRQLVSRASSAFHMLLCIWAHRDGSGWKPYASSEERIRFPFMYAVVPGIVTASTLAVGG